MFRILVAVALLVIAFAVAVLGVLPHVFLAHWFTVTWAVVLAIAAPFGWQWFAAYKATAEIALRVYAAEGRLWTQLMLHLEGSKGAVLMLFVSGFSAAKDWVDSTLHMMLGVTPDQLDPFKDIGLLHAFFSDAIAPKIVSGITLFAAFLSIHSKLQAARLVPAPGSPPAA